MARTTSNGLYVWNLSSDAYNHAQLAANWDAVDSAMTKANNAVPQPAGPSTSDVLNYNGTIWTNTKITNANVSASAAIAYSKLALSNSVVNGDIGASAGIVYSKLNLNGSVINADISNSAAIAIAKLAGYPSDVTKFLAGNGTWVAPSTATFFRKTTSKTVNTSITETDLLNGEFTIGANAMSTNKKLRLWAAGDFLQNTGSTQIGPRLKLKLGATAIIDSGAPTGLIGTSANRGGWILYGEIQELGVTNSQLVSFQLFLYGIVSGASAGGTNFTTGTGGVQANLGGSGIGNMHYIGINTTAVDTTVSQVLAFTVINGANSGTYETRLQGAVAAIE